MLYWLGYVAIHQLNIHKERENIHKRRPTRPVLDTSTKKDSSILEKFKVLVEDGELYLNPELKQSDIAEKMGFSSNYLSKILNEKKSMNFNEYINTLRIYRAKELLLNDEFQNYTNAAIGLESGFNSKSTFFKAFKKHTGTTPSNFKTDLKNKISPEF